MKVALAQIDPKLNSNNFDLHQRFIKEYENRAEVIIFPELSMNGYMLMDATYEDAFLLQDLQIFEKFSQNIDIIFGAVTKEEHKIFNSALYYSKGRLLNIHHKNHLPNYGMFQEARFFFKGDELSFFDTNYGKVCMVVCEDLWSSKIIDQISTQKPDIVYVIAASPARGFENNTLEIEHKWNQLLSTTAFLSGSYVVFVNRVGFEDGVGFWGGSRVINPSGNIELTMELFEEQIGVAKLEHNLSFTQKYLLRT